MQGPSVLGSRRFSDSDGAALEVVFYVPRPNGHGDFVCEYSLNGLSWAGKVRHAHGVDAVQAIYLALRSVGSDIKEHETRTGRALTWVGQSHTGDSGLPTL